MRHSTELMERIFSEDSKELQNQVAEKIDEARENGTAELKDSKSDLAFAEVGNGDVAIEDKNNGGEVTIASTDKNGETKLEAVVPEQKAQSATLPDVNSTIVKSSGSDGTTDDTGLDSGDTLPDVNVTIEETEGIVDKDKAGVGKSFSLCFNGFESPEEAEHVFSMINESLNFSDGELENVADLANNTKETHERALGTKDPEVAAELKDKAECLKAYSVLAENYGHDMTDLYEAACFYSEEADEIMNEIFSDMTVNEYFSNLDEEEAEAYFSNLNEVEAEVIFSALESDEDYTFSDVDEICDEIYSDLEAEEALSTPMTAVFSEMAEDELNEYMCNFSDSEYLAISELLDENPDATFSDVNEVLSEINVPVTEMFSEMTEDDVDEFCQSFSDDELAVFSMMVDDEESNYIYSDFLDFVIENRSFSDEDKETLKENAENLKEATEDMKKSDDAELAKKVKVLADKTLEDCEKAECNGHDVDDIKEKVASYSEAAAQVLDKKGIDPKKVTAESVAKEDEAKSDFDALDTNSDGYITEDEWKSAGKDADEFKKLDANNDGKISKEEYAAAEAPELKGATKAKSDSASETVPSKEDGTTSEFSAYMNTDEDRLFSSSDNTDTTEGGSNPCLFSPIN